MVGYEEDEDFQNREGLSPSLGSINNATLILNKNIITTGSRTKLRSVLFPPFHENGIDGLTGCVESFQEPLGVPSVFSRVQPSLLNTQVVDGIHTIQPPKKLLR